MAKKDEVREAKLDTTADESLQKPSTRQSKKEND
jgi:hypothetical protein